jgi:DNA-binding NarL/FixJ family response regulator
MIHVVACESQPVVVEGVRRGLAATHDLTLVGAVSDPKALTELVARLAPEVCLIDKAFGTRLALRLIADLRASFPQMETILWGVDISEVESFGALQAGARGILKKALPIQVILDCLRTVAKGNVWIESSISNQFVGFINRRTHLRLTPREEEILDLVMRGMKNKQIAQTLQISAGTVKVHIMHMFEKTGAKDRFELARYRRKLTICLNPHLDVDSEIPIVQRSSSSF